MSTVAKLDSSKSELEKSQRELERNVGTPFKGTTAQLQEAIQDYQSSLERSERELKEVWLVWEIFESVCHVNVACAHVVTGEENPCPNL